MNKQQAEQNTALTVLDTACKNTQVTTQAASSMACYRFRQQTFLLALVALGAGILFYAVARLNPLPGEASLAAGAFNAIPSLSQAIFITLMLLLCAGKQRWNAIALVAANVLVMLVGERLLGTFAWLDVVAIVVGTAMSSLWWWLGSVRHWRSSSERDVSRRSGSPRVIGPQRALAVLFLATSVVGITGTSKSNLGVRHTPVYMDYQTLRTSVEQVGRRNFGDVGRLYLYGDYLFLNERNIGIHVIDNSNPFDPQKISFIVIPGNTEISIREDNLYANSYVDLVTLDISDIEQISEVNRVDSIFPYDAYQNVPDDIYFSDVDETRGVVVDYR